MKYTEIFNKRYEDAGPVNKLELPISEMRAWRVLETLGERGGFDHWWDGIEDDDKNDLFEELAKVLR